MDVGLTESIGEDSGRAAPNLHPDMTADCADDRMLYLKGITKTVHVGLRRRAVTILRGVDLSVLAGTIWPPGA